MRRGCRAERPIPSSTGIILSFVGSIGLRNSTEFEGSNAGVSAGDIGLLAGYAVLMLCVCPLACIVPACARFECSRRRHSARSEKG